MLWNKKNILVLISAYNEEKYLLKCLDSVEEALKNHKWKMIFCNDGSEDNTLAIAKECSRKSSADEWIIKTFPKSKNVAQAKNRTLRLGKKYSKDYPAICFMDADDKMGPKRVTKLLKALVSENQLFAFGDYVLVHENGDTQTVRAKKIYPTLRFGIWATLFHESLIDEEENFFREDFDKYSDLIKWWELKYINKINFLICKGFTTNFYYRGHSCINKGDTVDALKKLQEEKKRICAKENCGEDS